MADGTQRQARLTALYDYARQMVQGGKAGLFDFITHLRRLLERATRRACPPRRRRRACRS